MVDVDTEMNEIHLVFYVLLYSQMKEMKNAMQQQMTNMQSRLAALMRQMGHRVPTEHPPAEQPTTDPPANDEDDDLGLDD